MYITVESNHMFTSLVHQSEKIYFKHITYTRPKTLFTIYILLIHESFPWPPLMNFNLNQQSST